MLALSNGLLLSILGLKTHGSRFLVKVKSGGEIHLISIKLIFNFEVFVYLPYIILEQIATRKLSD